MFSLFSKPKAFAVDITDESLQVLEVRANGKVRVLSNGKAVLPKGIIENGRVKDQKKFAELLRKTYSSAAPHAPKGHRIAVALPESETYTLHLSLDRKINKTQLPDAVMKEAARSLPFSLDQYMCDFQLLATTEKTSEIVFVAAPTAIVEEYQKATKLAGLDLVILEPESLALCRALLPGDSATKAQHVLVVVPGRSWMNCLFVDARGVQLSISIPMPAVAPVQELPVEVTPLKKRRKAVPKKEVAPKSASNVFGDVIQEIRRATEYLEGKIDGKIDRGILVTDQLPNGFRDELDAAMGFSFETALSPCASEGLTSLRGMVACGLAMRASKQSVGIDFVSP